MRCIYLDQFVTSGIFDPDQSYLWNEIRELLKKGVGNGKIICPMSVEHFLESSQKEVLKAINLDNEFYKLSRGYAFKSELFITSQLIISTIRKNNITAKTFLYDNIKKNVLSNKDNFKEFDLLKKELNIKITEATYQSNEIRKITRNIRADKKTKTILINAHKALSVNSFLKRMSDLLTNGNIVIKGVKFPSGDIPNWIDLIIHQLTSTHKMKTEEAIMLFLHLKKYGFNKIPTLDISSSISAMISVNQKNENVNDHVDIMRISTGLPISDILLTDQKRKNEIIELGLDKKYNTLVLSGTESDLKIFIKELKKLNE